MAFEKSNQNMCKLMAKVGCIFADHLVNPPSWWRQNKWDAATMNDVMIAATLHYKNQTLLKNTRHVFMNEMEHFGVSSIQDGIHARR